MRHAAIAGWLVACAVRSPQYEAAQGPPVYGDPSQGAEPQMSESFPSGTSQAPQTYSLDLKNECAETVDLFIAPE